MNFKTIIRDRRLWWLTIIVFLLLITVLDRNNLLDRAKLKDNIRTLETQKEYYRQRVEEDSTLLESLKQREFMEKYAREHYLFRRDGERVYVIR